MTLQRNHYEILGVSPTATTDEIKKKYRELARKFHPDVVKDKDLGQKIFTQVNQAYRVLGDPERRAQYDTTLRADRDAARPSTNGAAPGPLAPAPSTQGFAAQAARPGAAGPARNGTAAPGVTPQAARPAAQAAPAAPKAAPQAPQPSAQQTQAINKSLSDADFALMNGDAKAARAACEAALRIDPRNARALGMLGDALVALDQREAAAAAYRHSLQFAPSARVQASLARLESGALPNRTNPPDGAAPRPRTNPPGGQSQDKPSGGLFGRLMGKKK